MATNDDLARNAAKIAAAVGLTWIAYKIVSGLSKNQSASQIVKETVKPIETAASEVKKISKKLLKGSPEAKARMAELRNKAKGVKRGDGVRARRKKSKAEAGKMGGEATADKGQHKGHSSKKGLAQDQKKSSKEKHEKHYRKSKNQEGFDSYYG